MSDFSLAIVGLGNMGSAIASGFLKTNTGSRLHLVEPDKSKMVDYELKGVNTYTSISALPEVNGIIFCVKPWIMPTVMREIAAKISNQTWIASVATGVSLEQMQSVLGNRNIARIMPNTAVSVGESLSFITNNLCDDGTLLVLQQIFSPLGKIQIIDESNINAATALSSSGIAYGFRFVRALMGSGIKVGFSADASKSIAIQTLKGALAVLESNPETHPESEIDKVTTPKGSTITALMAMEANGFSHSVNEGVLAAYHLLEKQ